MCGIVCAVAQRDVGDILLEGLKRLEYRGYDSAGVAIITRKGELKRLRAKGKVALLSARFKKEPILGSTGIAHTRWATHGAPSEKNAHPHLSHNTLAVVHNGIIENHEPLRKKLMQAGYQFESDTDTEVIAHLLHFELSKEKNLVKATQKAAAQLHGAYAIGILCKNDPNRIIAVRRGSPLVVGLGIGENFIASDNLALLPVTQKFIYLNEGDLADVTREKVTLYDKSGKKVQRDIHESELEYSATSRGKYRHFMLKEIYEQPTVISDTLYSHLDENKISPESFGPEAEAYFKKTNHIQIVACGTSYHAGLVAKYWFEELANISCSVEIASEFRYRKKVILPNTLLVTISQSGETADTIAALKQAKTEKNIIASLAICNVPESTLIRESDFTFVTRAGKEIGVASTKAFTTQLAALFLMVMTFAQNKIDPGLNSQLVQKLKKISEKIERTLALDDKIKTLAELFKDKKNALFLGRGSLCPIAMEGALKLKEISYIHAEAYPAGELKHGPLALVDKDMPVIVIAPYNDLLEKLKSNIEEVRARGGHLIIFADPQSGITSDQNTTVIPVPKTHPLLAPIVYTIPLQLLAYHVALIKGTDVDQPRNLAKSVTVE